MSISMTAKNNSNVSNDDIIEKIGKALEKKGFKSHASQSEIVVKDTTKKEVLDIINSLIEKDDITRLLEVVETKKTVYVRKKISTR